MAENKNDVKDLRLLYTVRSRQRELMDGLQHFGVTTMQDLAVSKTMHYVVRRGLVQMVGDIFELTKGLQDETKQHLELDLRLIRNFRNTATHNYGALTNKTVYACVMHCVSSQLMQSVSDEISRLEEAGVHLGY